MLVDRATGDFDRKPCLEHQNDRQTEQGRSAQLPSDAIALPPSKQNGKEKCRKEVAHNRHHCDIDHKPGQVFKGTQPNQNLAGGPSSPGRPARGKMREPKRNHRDDADCRPEPRLGNEIALGRELSFSTQLGQQEYREQQEERDENQPARSKGRLVWSLRHRGSSLSERWIKRAGPERASPAQKC